MKKLYNHIYLVSIFFAVTFVIGTFFDYQINDALFHNKDNFGLTFSAIGTIPGYGVLSFMGGGLLFYGFKRKFPHVAWRIVTFILAVACIGFSIYFSGREFFGRNGFENAINPLFGYLIILPVSGGLTFFGYYVSSKSDNDKLWLVYFVIAIAFTLALLGGVTLLKAIFHRPRFRAIVGTPMEGLNYHPWYVPFKGYESYSLVLGKEEFKSFPSGHAGSCSAFMMFALFLPLINKKYEKYQIPLFYVGFVWTLLISFTRMYVGAHFLSDVSMGALLPIGCFAIGKLVINKVKYFSTPSYEIKEEEVKLDNNEKQD